LPQRRADLALVDLGELPLERVAHLSLLGRCWELRANLTICDAAYVAEVSVRRRGPKRATRQRAHRSPIIDIMSIQHPLLRWKKRTEAADLAARRPAADRIDGHR